MSSSSSEESEEEGNFVKVTIDTANIFQALSLITSSIQGQLKTTKVKDQCKSSTRKRSYKASAGGGEGSKRPKSKGKIVDPIDAFECDACERLFATEQALRHHDCAPASNAPKFTRAASTPAPAALLHSKHGKQKIRWPCNYCEGTYVSKSCLSKHVKRFHLGKEREGKFEQQISPKKKDNAHIQTTLPNAPSESRLVDNSVAVTEFCNHCNTSIPLATSKAHAATHKINNYVEVEADSSQNIGQTQLGSPGRGNRDGTVEPWLSDGDSNHSLRNSSYVLEVDVHAERGENVRSETTGHSDSGHNSKDNGHEMAAGIETTINAVATPEEQTAGSSSAGTRHVQDIEGQEEEWDMRNQLMGDLENLLGPAGTGADADKSCSDIQTTQELQESLESGATDKRASGVNNGSA